MPSSCIKSLLLRIQVRLSPNEKEIKKLRSFGRNGYKGEIGHFLVYGFPKVKKISGMIRCNPVLPFNISYTGKADGDE
jgi:hypothetical protein